MHRYKKSGLLMQLLIIIMKLCIAVAVILLTGGAECQQEAADTIACRAKG